MGRWHLPPYTIYDRLSEVDQGAIVDNKRLGHALAMAAEVQALRDNRRRAGPSHTLMGEPPRPAEVPPSVKRQRLINRLDLERAMQVSPPCTAPWDGPTKPHTHKKKHARADI